MSAAPAVVRAQRLAVCAYPVVTVLAFPQRVAGVVFDFGWLCAWLSPLLLLLALRGLGPRAALWRGFWLGLVANAALLYFIAHTVITYGHAPPWLGALAPFALGTPAAATTALFSVGVAWLARARARLEASASRDASPARAQERLGVSAPRDASRTHEHGALATSASPVRVSQIFARGTRLPARASVLHACAANFATRALRSQVCAALALAALWTALDHLRSFVFGGFPWGTLGYAQHQNTPLLGLVSWTGVYGLSFVTVWVAALLVLGSRASRVVAPAHAPHTSASPRLASAHALDPVAPSGANPRGHARIEHLRTFTRAAFARLRDFANTVRARLRVFARAVLVRLRVREDIARVGARAGFALLLCHALGLWLAPPPLAGPALRVAVLQGNIAQGVKWSPDWGARTLRRYEALAREAAARGAQLIAFPETALPGTLDVQDASAPPAPDTFRARIAALARETGAALVVGAVGLTVAPDDYALYDSAYVFAPDGTLTARYDKTHLVPFGEYLPLRAWLERFVRPLATGAARRDLTPGPAPRALTVTLPTPAARAQSMPTARAQPTSDARDDTPSPADTDATTTSAAHAHPTSGAHDDTPPLALRLGAVICYELLFPDLVRRMPRDGARLLLGMTNDAWYGATGAPDQFLAMTALRAAENGVWLARAANTGISAFVDERGRVREQTKIFERALLIATLRLPEVGRAPTFYARHGDWFARACWFFAALLGGAALWRSPATSRQHLTERPRE